MDELISQGALLGVTKKDLVAEAVKDYLAVRREEVRRRMGETKRVLGRNQGAVGLPGCRRRRRGMPRSHSRPSRDWWGLSAVLPVNVTTRTFPNSMSCEWYARDEPRPPFCPPWLSRPRWLTVQRDDMDRGHSAASGARFGTPTRKAEERFC